jgi:hypothetical protein
MVLGATPAGGPKSAEDIMNQYVQNTFAKNVDGTMALFENRADTYFHINGVLYFTVDKDQSLFQIAPDKNYIDGWNNIHDGFANYFAGLIDVLSIKIVTRTKGQGMNAPLDGGDKIDGETNYVLLAKFYVDNEGHTGYGIVHGLDQFRIKHERISNINNVEKTVFLTPDESAHLDTLTTNAKLQWGLNRTCELKNSVFASIDVEKRYDVELNCQ